MCNLNMQQDENLIYIYPSTQLPADARHLRVFPLDFARAIALEPTVQGLLSPVGNAYATSIDVQDTMSTQESLVVVDIPSVIAEVESYILQADQAPRQVVIEAHVLEVELSDDMFHGVNFEAMLGGDLTVGSFGLADNIASKANPLFFAEIDGSDVTALITMLETTTDSKTLASPRVQVINGQNARIQVGQQLGFTVATVTQTSTIQDIQFLETGVVLSVTPTISRDGRILMEVKPEVSDGEINPITLLPEEETREVETSVLLDNHQGVIIGGLIQEKDRTVIKKLPWVGDFPYVGKLFQRREAVRSRSEIIIALVPHIVERCVQDERSAIDVERAQSPLLLGPLHRNCRPWEPRLPDSAGQEHCFNLDLAHPLLP
jgi:type II secretory pathway component GspD/PulD (secretin)